MRVATQPALETTRCACTDRYREDCTCTTLSRGRFFQCSSTQMPCTRHAHCNPDERCSMRPHCQKAGTVWPERGPRPTGGAECWNDKECEGDAARPQCGFLLFNLDAKHDPDNSVVKIDKTISPT